MPVKKFEKIRKEDWGRLQSAIIDMQGEHIVIRDNGSAIYHLPNEAVTLYYHGKIDMYGKEETIARARVRLEDKSGIKLEEI